MTAVTRRIQRSALMASGVLLRAAACLQPCCSLFAFCPLCASQSGEFPSEVTLQCTCAIPFCRYLLHLGDQVFHLLRADLFKLLPEPLAGHQALRQKFWCQLYHMWAAASAVATSEVQKLQGGFAQALHSRCSKPATFHLFKLIFCFFLMDDGKVRAQDGH